MKQYICEYEETLSNGKKIYSTKYIKAYSEGEAKIKVQNKLRKTCKGLNAREVSSNLFK